MTDGFVVTVNNLTDQSTFQKLYNMTLYYLPCLVRSDRYFITRLDQGVKDKPDFNFVIPAAERVHSPILTIEDPDKIALNQMAPSSRQDIPLKECHLSLHKNETGFELVIQRSNELKVDMYEDEESGLRLDYSASQRRICVGIYKTGSGSIPVKLTITLRFSDEEKYSTLLLFNVVDTQESQRVVIDFGSEASQIGYRNGSPQSPVLQYDILENVISQLKLKDDDKQYRREDFLNHEPGQPMLYRSFYAVKKEMSEEKRKSFPFNFTDSLEDDEIRLFITRNEVAATVHAFRDGYEIIPNLKLGIEKSLHLKTGNRAEDYSIRSHKQELISGILLRLLRLMISSKPAFRKGGIIVTLLVPNIYTQHDVFVLLDQLRERTGSMLASLDIQDDDLSIEYETISESDASFMGYQQTHPEEVSLSNGEIALVIDCGKGTTDISMLLADDNENYSGFFRTGFAGAGNVLLYGFAEDFLTLVLRSVPGGNDISVKDFIRDHIVSQNLTADVLNFIQLMEEQKRKFKILQPVGLSEFALLSENAVNTERTIYNLHRDQSTLLQYAETILSSRNIRWDEEITALISKACDCIVHSIISSFRDVVTKDIKRRIKTVMLSGRAFYFPLLKEKLEKELKGLLYENIAVKMIPQGRTLNNKNVSIYGAFSGAYKVTDFTGMPVDKKEGLSRNNDVLNNNIYLYRGIKIEPCNDILYNSSVVRRNNQELKSFRNKTIDVFFTRDNIYLRLMENQQVKDVKSLYSVLAPVAGRYSAAEDLKAISMFPNHSGETASLEAVYKDIMKYDIPLKQSVSKKRKGVLQYFLS